jgi:hypothetical protein
MASNVFFLNGKYNIINKQVSAQDEQILVKEGLHTKVSYISGTPKKLQVLLLGVLKQEIEISIYSIEFLHSSLL